MRTKIYLSQEQQDEGTIPISSSHRHVLSAVTDTCPWETIKCGGSRLRIPVAVPGQWRSAVTLLVDGWRIGLNPDRAPSEKRSGWSWALLTTRISSIQRSCVIACWVSKRPSAPAFAHFILRALNRKVEQQWHTIFYLLESILWFVTIAHCGSSAAINGSSVGMGATSSSLILPLSAQARSWWNPGTMKPKTQIMTNHD